MWVMMEAKKPTSRLTKWISGDGIYIYFPFDDWKSTDREGELSPVPAFPLSQLVLDVPGVPASGEAAADLYSLQITTIPLWCWYQVLGFFCFAHSPICQCNPSPAEGAIHISLGHG